MRAIVMSHHGGPEVLETRELPDPVPGPGDVRLGSHQIRHHAVGDTRSASRSSTASA